MKLNALVPMKDHSQRVPGKNVRAFCGAPLFCRIIEALKESKAVDGIYVDTDSDKIKGLVHKHCGDVIIIDRPRSLRGDLVAMNAIIGHDIGLIKGEHILQTHSTNPMMAAETIGKAVSIYFDKIKEGYDSLFGVEAYQARFYDSGSRPLNHDPKELLRTQDLDPIYKENSSIYIFSRKSFTDNGGNRIGRKPYLFGMDKTESMDIDTEEEFNMAEKMYMAVRQRAK